jgi:hypothetical protein
VKNLNRLSLYLCISLVACGVFSTKAHAAPTAPTNLTATAGNALVNLTWSASAGATSYNVYLGTAAGGEGATPIATLITGTSYTDTAGLINGTKYYYKVAAVAGATVGSMSTEVSATPSSARPPTAVRANDFLNTIGVNTHLTPVGGGGNDPTQVANLVKQLGIRHIRDGCQDQSNQSQCVSTLVSVYQNSGATFDIVTSAPNGQTDLTQQLNEAVTLASAGALLSVEGPNEIWNPSWGVTWNGQTSSTSTTFLPAAEFQNALYSQSHGKSALTNYPVFDLTGGGDEPDNVGLQYVVIPSGAGTLMPDGTVYANYANVHNYIDEGAMAGTSCPSTFATNWVWGAFSPTLQGCWDGLWYFYGTNPPYFPAYTNSQLLTLPRVDTENGIAEGSFGFTDAQIGDAYLNLFLDAVKEGWSYAFIYDLVDDGTYGLVNGDYSLRTQAEYLQSFTTILADISSNFAAGTLNYSVENEPTTVHDLLLQKSNGTFYIALWDEEVPGSGTTDPVTVNLGGTYTVTEYDPTQGTSPIETFTDVSSLSSLTLSDHPVLLQLTPPNNIKFVQATSASSGSSSVNSEAATFTSANNAGDLIVVALEWYGATTVKSVADSANNTYKPAVGPSNDGSGDYVVVYYASNVKAKSGNKVTVTLNASETYLDLDILEYSGVSTLDKTATGTGNSTTAKTSSATTTAANELIFGTGNSYGSSFTAPGSGFTFRADDVTEDMIVSTTGSYSASATISASDPWVMQMATFY